MSFLGIGYWLQSQSQLLTQAKSLLPKKLRQHFWPSNKASLERPCVNIDLRVRVQNATSTMVISKCPGQLLLRLSDAKVVTKVIFAIGKQLRRKFQEFYAASTIS